MSKIGDLKIVPHDNIILRSKNLEVIDFDDELRLIVAEMKDAMEIFGGVGLAAPQVGLNRQIFVWEWGYDQHEVINPSLELTSPWTDPMPEGCLSLPDQVYSVCRACEVNLKGFNMYGEPICINAIGHLARIFQHEFNHLEGKLISDVEIGQKRFKEL